MNVRTKSGVNVTDGISTTGWMLVCCFCYIAINASGENEISNTPFQSTDGGDEEGQYLITEITFKLRDD